MAVIPSFHCMVIHLQAGEDLVHGFSFCRAVPDKCRIIHSPRLEAILRSWFAETRGRMRDDSVDVDISRYIDNLFRLVFRRFAFPAGSGLRVAKLLQLLVIPHPDLPVYADGSADNDDIVARCSDNRVVRNTSPALILDAFFGEVGRIIVVSPDEYHPVVCLPESAGYLVVDRLVVARLFETEATVPGHDEECVCTLPTDAEFVDERLEIAVNISRNNDLFSVRIFSDFTHFRHGYSVWKCYCFAPFGPPFVRPRVGFGTSV